jgi:hypothetical protein
MAKKLIYPPMKEVIRLGRGKPPSRTSTFTEPAPYVTGRTLGRHAPSIPKEVVEVLRRRQAERPLKPVSRRTLALVARLLKKLERD